MSRAASYRSNPGARQLYLPAEEGAFHALLGPLLASMLPK
jgi:hypothetical protein